MISIISQLASLINIARALGLNETDLYNAEEFIEHREFGLSFDLLITQMYEYDIEINDQIYDLINSIGNQLKLSNDRFDFMQELIRSDKKIPKPIAEELIKVIKSL